MFLLLAGIMSDYVWRPLVKQVGLVGDVVLPSVVVPILEKGVNLLVRLALLLLVLLRLILVSLPLYWLRRSGMIVLGRLAAKSQGPLRAFVP